MDEMCKGEDVMTIWGLLLQVETCLVMRSGIRTGIGRAGSGEAALFEWVDVSLVKREE